MPDGTESNPRAAACIRLRLRIAYDGSCFRGWQSQASRDAVQDCVEQALERIAGVAVQVHGAGRTDAGVHALGQVAHADVPMCKLDPSRWQAALNANLPPGARVVAVTRASPSFHARFSAKGKIYTYRIWNEAFLHPLEIGRAWHLPGALDIDALRKSARLLEGTHDFASFAANRGKPESNTVRTVHSITVRKRGSLVTLQFAGDGFLYKMVRLLTGCMARCGQGRESGEWLEDLLHGRGRKAQYAAPAAGLYLTRVLY